MSEPLAESDYALTESEIDEVYRRWQQKVNFTYMLSAVDQIVREHMAQAWDEGLRFGQQHWATNYAGVYENGSLLRAAPNPYRVSPPGPVTP